VSEFLHAIAGKKTIMPDFRDGAQCVAVLDAVEKSIAEGKWAKVEAVE
jgi:predicted dehydrogenase